MTERRLSPVLSEGPVVEEQVQVVSGPDPDPDPGCPTGRTGNVSFKPYDDIRRKPPKKRFWFGSSQDLDPATESSPQTTTVDHLYPELLCLIFSELDTGSKGRVAQVSLNNPSCNIFVSRDSCFFFWGGGYITMQVSCFNFNHKLPNSLFDNILKSSLNLSNVPYFA